MTISRICLVVVSLFVAAQAAMVEAQIINSSPAEQPEGVQQAVSSEEEAGGILPTSWPSITMPKLTMPKLTMPKIGLPKWPKNEDGISVSPFAPISAGASKVTAGTKKAWEGTKEMFSFGGKEEATQPQAPAATESKPSFWQRLKGEEPEPTGPQTVAEWMAQPRLDP